jgi:AbrB family looped-hinge helix DNA binding protein
MASTTVSSKYQVVIPKAIREKARLHPGDKLTVILKGRVISLVPEVSLEQMCGIFPQLDLSNIREKEDRL